MASCAREPPRPALAMTATGDDEPGVSGVQVHFGPVLVGSQYERWVSLSAANAKGKLRVAGVEKAPGFEPSFSVDAVASGSMNAVAATLRFFATTPGPATASVTVELQDESGAVAPVAIQVTGTAIESCEPATESLDFAAVSVGDSAVRPVVLRNPGATPWTTWIDVSPDGVFSLADGAAAHLTTLPGGDGASPMEVAIQFSPRAHGEASRVVGWPTPVGCPLRSLKLVGFGVSRTLTCEPTVIENGRPVCRVDFGPVERSVYAKGRVVLRNNGATDVGITRSVFRQPPGGLSQFSVQSHGMKYRVPPGGDAVPIELEFFTTGTGWLSGALELSTDDPTRPKVAIDLRGGGIGPKLELDRESLDFGVLGVSELAHAQIEVRNAGLAPADSPDAANLLLPTPPEISGSEAFSVLWPAAGYGPAGIPVGASVPLTVLFAPGSFGRFTGAVTIASNDPARPEPRVELVAVAAFTGGCVLEMIPPLLDFGALASGEAVTLPLFLRNVSPNSGAACALSGFEVASLGGGSGSPFAISDAPSAVLGGETQMVRVRFAPTSEGSFPGELRFSTSDPVEPQRSVPIHADCGAVPVRIVPRDLELGTNGDTCSTIGLVALINPETVPLRIDAVEIDPSTPDDAFALYGGVPSMVPASGQATIGFRIRETAAVGIHAATAMVRLAGAAPLTVGLHARAGVPRLWMDEFKQPPLPSVDLLIVIDDSPAMADKQASLARNFASFIHYMAQQRNDWHLAVTTTSVGAANDANGRLLPLTEPVGKVFTRTTPDLEQAFSQLIQVGSSGDPNPLLMKSAQLALSAPLASGHNAGFYRPDAKLAIVVISASADQDSTPVSDYENSFLSLKGIRRRNDMTYSAVIPFQLEPPADCAYGTTDAGTSPRAKQLVQRTGGLQDEICDPDWSRMLERRGSGSGGSGLRTTFFLSHSPELSRTDPIVVELDDLPFPQYGKKGDKRWDYNSESNAVEFDPLEAPDPDVTVRITYRIACGGS